MVTTLKIEKVRLSRCQKINRGNTQFAVFMNRVTRESDCWHFKITGADSLAKAGRFVLDYGWEYSL